MLKRVLILAVLVGGFALVSASEASAARWRRGVVYRRPVAVAPVRRVVRRAAWATYPAVGPIVARPVVRGYGYGAYGYGYSYPAYPYYYGPGVSVQVGF